MIDVHGKKALQEALKLAVDSLYCAEVDDIREAISLVVDTALGAPSKSNQSLTSRILSIPGFVDTYEDLPGMYEYLLSLKPEHSSRSHSRKATGSFYTPPDVVQFVVERCVETLCENSTPINPDDIRILDPAVGCGAFLIETADQLSGKLGIAKHQIAEHCLYGYDVDPIAVRIAGTLLSRPGMVSQSISDHISVGDSLLQESGKYDIVLGNPPWISLKGKHKSGTRDDTYISKVQQRFGGDTYRPNLMESFVRMAIDSLKPGGVNCFIVPDRLAANAQFAELRAAMLRDNDLREVVFRVPFDGVAADAMIYLLVKGDSRLSVSVSYWEQPGSCIQLLNSEILEAPGCAISHPGTFEEQALVNNMEAHSIVMCPEVARTATGFIGAAGAITSERISDSQVEVIRGRNVLPYRLDGCAYFNPDAGIVGGSNRREVLDASPKLFVRKTGLKIVAALCHQPVWPEQSVYQIWEATGGYSLYYIMAVLNSLCAQFYCRMRMLTNRDTIPQIKKIDLDRFPIPKIDFITPTFARKRRVDFLPELSDLIALEDFAKQEIANGRVDVLHDIIGDLSMKICNEELSSEVTAAMEVLVAALYHIDLNELRSVEVTPNEDRYIITLCDYNNPAVGDSSVWRNHHRR